MLLSEKEELLASLIRADRTATVADFIAAEKEFDLIRNTTLKNEKIPRFRRHFSRNVESSKTYKSGKTNQGPQTFI